MSAVMLSITTSVLGAVFTRGEDTASIGLQLIS